MTTETTDSIYRARVLDRRTETESGLAPFSDIGPAKHYLENYALIRMNATLDGWRESHGDGRDEWTARLDGVDAVAIITTERVHHEASSLIEQVREIHADTTVDTIGVTQDA